MSWDTALFEFAGSCMETSWKKWGEGEFTSSWGYTIPARLAYVASVIVNIVQFPFAIIGVTLGGLHALLTLNYKSEPFQITRQFIIQKTNHALISAFGAAISPAIAHRFQNANLAPFVIAARVTVVSAALFYYIFS